MTSEFINEITIKNENCQEIIINNKKYINVF